MDADRRQMERQARTRSALNSLVALACADDEFDLEDFIAHYQRREAFTPRQMALLQWRFEVRCVAHEPRHFRVSLRRGREQEQLREMPDWKVRKLWPYLSPEQRRSCRAL